MRAYPLGVCAVAIAVVLALALVVDVVNVALVHAVPTWLALADIGPADPRVLHLEALLAEQESARDQLLAERAQAEASLAEVERVIAAGERASGRADAAHAVALEQARNRWRALGDRLAAIGRSVARYDALLAETRAAPLLAAADGRLTMALMPIENLAAATPGAPLHACALRFVVCHQVGTVVGVLPGELELRHPLHGSRRMRARPVQVQLSDRRAAASAWILFAGHAPL